MTLIAHSRSLSASKPSHSEILLSYRSSSVSPVNVSSPSILVIRFCLKHNRFRCRSDSERAAETATRYLQVREPRQIQHLETFDPHMRQINFLNARCPRFSNSSPPKPGKSHLGIERLVGEEILVLGGLLAVRFGGGVGSGRIVGWISVCGRLWWRWRCGGGFGGHFAGRFAMRLGSAAFKSITKQACPCIAKKERLVTC